MSEEVRETLLASTTLDQFYDQYWEQSPLHVQRNNADHFASLVTLDDIESYLNHRKCQFPIVQAVNKLQQIDVNSYTDHEGHIVSPRLIDLFNQGSTIVISQAQNQFISLSEFCREVQALFGLPCQTNLYLSPAQNQGFNPHYDSHDVFILQVSGSKRFNFYSGGVKLPYSDERFEADRHSCGEFQEAVTVCAGDSLYIPRGIMHDAVAQDETSLHITLGVYATTLRDAMIELVEQVSRESKEFRSSLNPFSSYTTDDYYKHALEALKLGLNQLKRDEQQKVALRNLRDSYVLNLSQNCQGLLTDDYEAQITNAATLNLHVSLETKQILAVEKQEQRLRLSVPGQIIELEGKMANAMLHLMNLGSLPLSNIPLDTEEERIDFCTSLMRTQLLVVSKS